MAVASVVEVVNRVDPLRHLKVFSPAAFGDRRVDVIGCGATGSRIALSLAKLGVSNLHIHDFDNVEEHNVANQVFGIPDIGRPKAEALSALIESQCGLEVTPHGEKVTGETELGNVVFLLTDTMASRKEIWEGAIKFKPYVELMVETRMGASEGRVYSVVPMNIDEINLWEGTLCEDEEASDSLCGARISVGPTAELVSGFAVWSLINWFSFYENGGDRPDVETIFYANPGMVMTRKPSAV